MSGSELRTVTAILVVFVSRLLPATGGETLCNGIVLPDAWPPRMGGLHYDGFRNGQDLKYHGPMAVPYLEHPPAVAAIDVGRQLFVDDFLIQNMNLKRTFHQARYHAASPVIAPEEPWEQGERGGRAMVNSDGVWFDPADQLFKMWYRAYDTCYAQSTDGLVWEKPELDVVPGTNIVLDTNRRRASSTVWLDLEEKDRTRRFKMITSFPGGEPRVMGYNTHLEFYCSPDGVHWGKSLLASPTMRDRSTAFFNPFRKVWVYSVKVRPCVEIEGERPYVPLTRSRAYRECRDFLTPWHSDQIVPWVGADNLDPCRNDGIDHQVLGGQHLYALDCVAYESIVLGLFTIFHGNGTGANRHHHMNDLTVGYSRDGFHWHRPDRRAFLGVGDNRKKWNYNNIQSAGGCCLVVGDELWFYVSGRNPGSVRENCNTGLATLRRDGFASLDAGEAEGVVVTRPVVFRGKHLFVNVDCPDGELRVDVLREDVMNFFEPGDPVIEPFTRDACKAVRTNSTRHRVQWEGADDLSHLVGRPVRFRFYLRGGRLYSFWVSPDETGASHGYVAAGGPGLTGPRDTVGSGANEE